MTHNTTEPKNFKISPIQRVIIQQQFNKTDKIKSKKRTITAPMIITKITNTKITGIDVDNKIKTWSKKQIPTKQKKHSKPTLAKTPKYEQI